MNKFNNNSRLMEIMPQAIVIIGVQNKEVIFANSAADKLLFRGEEPTIQLLAYNIMRTQNNEVIRLAICSEIEKFGKSVMEHVCIRNKDNLAERYDIHIAYVDDTKQSVCLVFTISANELERMKHQNDYYRSISNVEYSYPFHLDIEKRRMEFFNPALETNYHMPMVIDNFPNPIFDFDYICEEDVEDYKNAVARMYKGESTKGSFRFYDTKGELFRYNVNYVINRDVEGNPIEANGDFIIQSEAQNALEYKTKLQEIVNECMDIFFTVGATDKDPKTAYIAVLNIVKEYYHAEGVYFYKFMSDDSKVERVHTAFDDNLKSLELALPTFVNAEELQFMQLLTEIKSIDASDKLNSFGAHYEALVSLQSIYNIHGFESVGMRNIKGDTIAYMGMINPKYHKGNKELMQMLRRPISMFIEFQNEQRMQQELLKLEANSKADVVNECVENFREFAHYKEHISTVLTSLSNHYDADFAITMTSDKENNGDYAISYIGGSKIPNLEELQHQPASSIKKWEKMFQKHKHFITDADIDNKEAKKLLKEKFGIHNFITAPIKDQHGVLAGLLHVINYKTLNRSNLLTHIVANNISDYLDKINLYAEKHLEPLTKLTDKVATQKQIAEYLDGGVKGALFLIDIDHFKNLNDTLGHSVGDKVIVEISKEIKNVFRETDTVGRIGGDEFMVFCPNPISDELVHIKADLICKRCKKEYEKDGTSVKISASVGVLSISETSTTFQDAYERIDKALYVAKKNGKNQYRIYSEIEQKEIN